MNSRIVKVIVAVMFPIVVFGGVGKLQSWHSGRDEALACAGNPQPLNTRLSYDCKAVAAFWGALGADGRVKERRFLEEDLIFPTFYGGALGVSLVWLLSMTRLRWPRPLVLLPVAIGMAADWTENLAQLEQLRRYVDSNGVAGVDTAAILRSSIATDVKLAGIAMATALLLVLAWIAIRQPASG